jgi:flagellar biogenesis protein FliO
MEAIGQTTAVAAVLALLAGTFWWLRRRGLAGVAWPGKRGGRRLESLERLALGPQQVLHLVRFEDHTLLLASSPAGWVLIERIDNGEVRAPEVDR